MKSFAQKAVEKVREETLKSGLGLALFRLANRAEPQFHCPICDYEGPFLTDHPETGPLEFHNCPKCNSFVRHRLQFLVVAELSRQYDFSTLSLLHFAPEPSLQGFFRTAFKRYETADLCMKNVDFKVDLTDLPFESNSYDAIFASHVLEHIPDDTRAMAEISRILRPGGFAVLPVPIVAEKTAEYPAPNPYEAGHVRAPGPDYFDRYKKYFGEVKVYRSEMFPERHQLFIHEDRTGWPETMALRPVMQGMKHPDFVPVCIKR